MLQKVMEVFCGPPKTKAKSTAEGGWKIKGKVLLMKKNVLDFNDIKASCLDRFYELFGKGVSVQLISSVRKDPG